MTAASDPEFRGTIGERQGGQCSWGRGSTGGLTVPASALCQLGPDAELLQSLLILYRFYFALSCSTGCVTKWCRGCDLPYGSALTGSYLTLLLMAVSPIEHSSGLQDGDLSGL